MTFDPETLYARPKPGRRYRPIIFVAGGIAAVAVVGSIATIDSWWPGAEETTASTASPIRSNNSGNGSPPLQFPNRYAAYTPPAAPPPAAEPEPPPAAAPAPVRQSAPSGPPKKRGIPEEERRSSVVMDGSQGTMASAAPAGPVGGVQQVADNRSDREKFYGSAGRQSEVFSPTGIVGQLGACTVMPGTHIFHEAVGMISTSTPGQITAKTSRPIYAGPKGQCYASPAGATLIGTLNANTEYGDDRIQVAWTAMILPNGRMVELGGMPGASGDGATGLRADVNNHFGALAGAVLAGTAVDVIRSTANFGSQKGDVVINMGSSLADRTASIGERLVDRELNRRPSLTAKPEEMAVQVTRPIELERYRD